MKAKALWMVVIMSLFYFFCGMGCARKPVKNVVPKPETAMKQGMPSPEALFDAVPPSEGSLWTETSNMLFVDQKARRVGDTVIIDIVENTSSSIDANTTISKDASIEANLPQLLGYMQWLQTKNPNLDPDQLLSSQFIHSLTGEGESDRSGEITASIGAIVTNVLPNGNLIVFGQKEMKVNNETQYITVSGIVRPKDIDADNRIQSTYIADAKIEYSGKGDIADAQKVGWLSRAISVIWPF